MADGFTQVAPDSTGDKIDTSELTVGANTVSRQRVVLSDDATAAGLAKVANAAPAGTEYGLITRPIPSGTQAVSGTFWQATQPVSGPLTDVQLRATAVPVSGTFWQATQPVSGPLTDAQLRATAVPVSGTVTANAAQSGTWTVQPGNTANTTPWLVDRRPATLAVTVTAASGVAATLTLPAPGAGLFIHLCSLEIGLYATAARTGGATPVLVTSTNLPGSPVWNFETAQAVGAMIRDNRVYDAPVKASAAATAVTIVAPIATAGIWRITATYYTAA